MLRNSWHIGRRPAVDAACPFTNGAAFITCTRLAVLLAATAILPLSAASAQSAQVFDPAPAASAQGAVDSAALKQAATGAEVNSFYDRFGWQAVWTEDHAEALETALSGAAEHGLSPDTFAPDARDLDSPAAREAALTGAALSYAQALANGVAEPERLFEIYTLPRASADVAGGLASALENGDLNDWFDSLAPQDDEYRALSEAYQQALADVQSGNQRQIGGGGLIHTGESDPRVPAIAEALMEGGYLSNTPAGTTCTQAMSSAVRDMQAAAGIAVDGVVGPNTLQVLNRDAGDRARTLAVNLERRRWLPRQTPETRIDVNTAAAFLDYYRGGSHADHRRVIVGQPGWETPQLRSPMHRLVANPTWTVPKSIEREEFAGRGPAYLRRNNLERRGGWIVQLPGPDNALGIVKLDMKNDYAIYLHDTSARQLLDREMRHLSHGCVRVEDAPDFARMLAEDMGVLSEYEEAQASGGEDTFVDFGAEEIPVRMLYHTAFTEDGEVQYRPDRYGWDEKVAEALGLPSRDRQAMYAHMESVTP